MNATDATGENNFIGKWVSRIWNWFRGAKKGKRGASKLGALINLNREMDEAVNDRPKKLECESQVEYEIRFKLWQQGRIASLRTTTAQAGEAFAPKPPSFRPGLRRPGQ